MKSHRLFILRWRFLYCAFAMALIFAARPTRAFTAANGTTPAQDAEDWKMEVITVGPGKNANSRWGHSALRFRSLSAGVDQIIDFGRYDDRGAYLLAYVTGQPRYRSGSERFAAHRERYRRAGRAVYSQSIGASGAATRDLFRRLHAAARDSGGAFEYDHHLRNCVTIIRDILADNFLPGFRAYSRKPYGASLRELTETNLGDLWWFGAAIRLFVGISGERRIDLWESYFSPEAFMAGLDGYRKSRAANGAIPNEASLGAISELLPPGEGAVSRNQMPNIARLNLLFLFAALLAIGLPLIGLYANWRTGAATKRRAPFLTALARIWLLLLFAAISVAGVLIASAWYFTGIDSFQNNPHLLACDPLGLPAWALLFIARIRRPIKRLAWAVIFLPPFIGLGAITTGFLDTAYLPPLFTALGAGLGAIPLVKSNGV